MSAISNGLPAWAQGKVTSFLQTRTSPIEDASGQPLSASDARANVALIQDLADRMIASDNGPQDLDLRPGFIKKEVFKSGLTEDIRYRKDESGLELAYDFGDGHHAQYYVDDAQRAVLFDLAQGEHNHNVAVLVDKTNPANSVLFSNEL